MGIQKTFLIFAILCMLCILSPVGKAESLSLSLSQASRHLNPPDSGMVSGEEEVAPLPPVIPKPSGGSSPESKNKSNTQNGKDKDLQPIETSAISSMPGYCPLDGYRPGPLKAFLRHVIEDWRENNCWPNGLPELDRHQVHSTLETQIQNGWRRQNLLSDFHFQPETGQLNPAGQEKLRWILWEAPEKHRMVYVARAPNASETAARMASVQKAATDLVGDRPLPPILVSELSPPGWPSSQVDAIHRKFQETTPAPRLTTPPSNSSSTPSTP